MQDILSDKQMNFEQNPSRNVAMIGAKMHTYVPLLSHFLISYTLYSKVVISVTEHLVEVVD